MFRTISETYPEVYKISPNIVLTVLFFVIIVIPDCLLQYFNLSKFSLIMRHVK